MCCDLPIVWMFALKSCSPQWKHWSCCDLVVVTMRRAVSCLSSPWECVASETEAANCVIVKLFIFYCVKCWGSFLCWVDDAVKLSSLPERWTVGCSSTLWNENELSIVKLPYPACILADCLLVKSPMVKPIAEHHEDWCCHYHWCFPVNPCNVAGNIEVWRLLTDVDLHSSDFSPLTRARASESTLI